jgi:hypothetical protein
MSLFGVAGKGINILPGSDRMWAAVPLVVIAALGLLFFRAELSLKGSRMVRGWWRTACRVGVAVCGLALLAAVAACAGLLPSPRELGL